MAPDSPFLSRVHVKVPSLKLCPGRYAYRSLSPLTRFHGRPSLLPCVRGSCRRGSKMLDLKALWDDLAQRHRGGSGRSKPSGFQLFNRVADDFTRTLAGRDKDQLRPHLRNRATDGAAALPSSCVECGAGGLQHFFTSWSTGETLCARCFQERIAGPR